MAVSRTTGSQLGLQLVAFASTSVAIADLHAMGDILGRHRSTSSAHALADTTLRYGDQVVHH